MRPAIYWVDLLVSATLAWATFIGSYLLGATHPAYVPLIVVSALIWVRAGTFMHELAHRTRAELPGFHAAWNILVGIPATTPSSMGWRHTEHHAPHTFGTIEDPEWAPVPAWRRWRLLFASSSNFVFPWVLALRFGVVTVLSHLHPALRRHAVGKLSTNDIYGGYTRPPVPPERRRAFIGLEVACMALVWAGLIASMLGVLSWWFHLHRGLLMTLGLLFNHARLMVQHRYRAEGEPMSLAEQALDAVTLGPESPSTAVISPIGSRFHALHHALPGVPYHALPAAHRLLMAELPADHPYRDTVAPGFFAAWRARWAQAGSAP